MIACTAHRHIAGSRIKPPPKGKGAKCVFVGAPSQHFCNMFGWPAGMRTADAERAFRSLQSHGGLLARTKPVKHTITGTIARMNCGTLIDLVHQLSAIAVEVPGIVLARGRPEGKRGGGDRAWPDLDADDAPEAALFLRLATSTRVPCRCILLDNLR
jgi:hypothetical protein